MYHPLRLGRLPLLQLVSKQLNVAHPTNVCGIKIVSHYATHSSLGRDSGPNSAPVRKHITVISDDGRLQWSDLSRGEKAARATQQSINFLVVVIGAVMTGGVITFLYLDVFSPNSKTRQFDKAADRIKTDPRCTELLGNSKKIRAYGETTWNKWVRNRPIATTVEKDQLGREHLRMHFHVEGPLNSGTVSLHMVRAPDQNAMQYQLLALDVKGHPRIYLENAHDDTMNGKKPSLKIFGIQWR
ncbi:TIM21 domain containing protein [Elaphomyces granulatus]